MMPKQKAPAQRSKAAEHLRVLCKDEALAVILKKARARRRAEMRDVTDRALPPPFVAAPARRER